MNSTEGEVDHALRQERLSRFGRVLALVTLGYVGVAIISSYFAGLLVLSSASGPLLVAGAAFATLWLLLRGAPRSPRLVRVVELTTLFVATSAFSTIALFLDLTGSPDMIVRSTITYMLLVYAVYVPSTARHTLVVASLMTLPLLGCIFFAFRSWDPALHDPPAATWPRGEVGDMAYPATLVSAGIWGIAVAIAAGFSQTIYGLRKAVSEAGRLGQYTLEERIGEGGMGIVHRATHAMLRRPAAIKLLLANRAGEKNLARFEREVQLTSRLTHPNTISIFDYGRTDEGVFYYVMEFLDGMDLERLVEADGPVTPARAIHILVQVSGALAEAHALGLVHRDIKPANIVLTDRADQPDVVKVVDFGLVKSLGAAEGEQGSAVAVTGTPMYMAPEAISSPDSVDGRTDLYALGAVAYYLITGKHVFDAATVLEVCSMHMSATPVSPSERLGRPLPRDLEAIVLACLSKDRAARPASAAALRDALLACEDARRYDAAAAQAWWRDRGARLRASARPSRAAATGVVTMAIDLRGRSGNLLHPEAS
jgi:eukaryotic-like serine/threonine-protein kinase